DADLVLHAAAEASGWATADLLAPIVDDRPTVATVWAELFFGITHEGAADVGDLLDRRTRIGLVPDDRAAALPAAERALAVIAR
ncbi:MAG: glycerol-3-phosphate dehydrogenase, partial [Nocardioidaceae bacterium]|nr:glycerol-3-phosphate dehydrogenase [Nocardioidaceae bacterium]